jgi:ribonuclease R
MKVKGTIRVHPRGFGFVEAEEDIFIPRSRILGAVDGDTVEAMITGESDKGVEGEVVKIVKRSRSHLAGTMINSKFAYAPLLGPDREVEVKGPKLKRGDRVVLKVTRWDEPVKGELERVIGRIDDPSIDVEAACEEFELRTTFPKFSIPTPSLEGREDLREIACVTIDPESARDFDDAIAISKNRGGYELMVHIADVSAYVEQGSSLDREAQTRCNSTYFPGTCIPMLPPELSNDLCSLKPDVDRLAFSVIMQFNKKGELKQHRIVRTMIRSQRRFTYEEAKQVIDGKLTSPFKPMIDLMVELCGLLKHQRRERGSIEFALPEVVLQVDEKGVPIGTRVIEYDITHQMIEEFMLKANEVVATYLTKIGRGLTYRVHDMPTWEDLEGFLQMASLFGYKLSDEPTLEELQDLFDKARGTPHGPQLAVSFIRSMKLATYSAENIGHYGLSLEHYCHFTSPIRRYPDLLVHRVLLDAEAYKEKEIAKIAHRCSEQERISARAEQNVLRLKKLRYIDARPNEEWAAIVTQVKPFGLIFEVENLMLEGFIHISEVGDDYYVFQEGKLRGRSTRETFMTGTKITVVPRNIDLVTSEIQWDMV